MGPKETGIHDRARHNIHSNRPASCDPVRRRDCQTEKIGSCLRGLPGLGARHSHRKPTKAEDVKSLQNARTLEPCFGISATITDYFLRRRFWHRPCFERSKDDPGVRDEMKIWIKYNNEDAWKEWFDVLTGIASIRPYEQVDVLFVIGRPLHEMETLLSGIAIVRRICGTAVSVLAICPCPSLQWISQLKSVGVDSVLGEWAVSSRGQRIVRVSCQDEVRLTEDACPALHTIENEKEAHSVCGRHNDRMVLAHHHLEKWCLENKDECPHWNENA